MKKVLSAVIIGLMLMGVSGSVLAAQTPAAPKENAIQRMYEACNGYMAKYFQGSNNSAPQDAESEKGNIFGGMMNGNGYGNMMNGSGYQGMMNGYGTNSMMWN